MVGTEDSCVNVSEIDIFRLSVQNNETKCDSVLIKYYKTQKSGNLTKNFNISECNTFTISVHPRLYDQFPATKDNRNIGSSQSNRSISHVKPALKSSVEVNSNAWTVKEDKLNINNQSQSVSDNRKEYVRTDVGTYSLTKCKAYLIGCLIGSLLGSIALTVILTIWLKGVQTPTTDISVHPRQYDQFSATKDNRNIGSSQSNRSISHVKPALKSSVEVNSNAWTVTEDKLNINNQSQSVSDNRKEYVRTRIAAYPLTTCKACLTGCLIGSLLGSIALAQRQPQRQQQQQQRQRQQQQQRQQQGRRRQQQSQQLRNQL
ncbi:unnamed protein product [Rotaria sordida]|uniref:Uncharacterized protein n=3 Tax=Rotaria sordida TaxID=392033 RepID=A0A814R5T4_9BILA|nr:unnamed protein product [Rotaria sordida]